MSHRCKICNIEFEDKARLDRHKKVHGRRPKIYEYEYREFNLYRITG